MSYMALYRKFRPTVFEDVKGQDHIVTTLKNQINAGRLGHAYLFTGTRGTGKTTVAKILAKTVNCQSPVNGSPCCECASCKAIANGTSMDVIEMDAASNNGVENIRQIVEEVAYAPVSGGKKVYIIDEVHMLSGSAFNALLKTLEEPPEYVIFILATTEVHKIPITILSRCQRYDFRRITVDTISSRLADLMKEEGIDAEEKALRYVAKVGDGSMRDSMSLLDRCISFYFGQTLTYDKVLDILGAVDSQVFCELLSLIDASDVKASMEKLEELVLEGRELGQFVTDFLTFLRNILLLKLSETSADMIDVSAENLQTMKEIADKMEENQIERYIRVLSETSDKMRFATQKRILLETSIIKLCVPAMEKTADSLADEVRVLRKKMESGQFVSNSSQNVAAAPKEAGMSKEEYLKIVPGDVQKVNEMWDKVVAKSKSIAPFILSLVRTADRRINPETKQLTVVLGPTPNYLIFDRETDNGKKNYDALISIIEEVAGGSIDVEIQCLHQEASTPKAGTVSIADIQGLIGEVDNDFEAADDYE